MVLVNFGTFEMPVAEALFVGEGKNKILAPFDKVLRSVTEGLAVGRQAKHCISNGVSGVCTIL